MLNTTDDPSAEDWRRALDALPELICALDAEYKVRWMNAAMAKKLGVTQAEARGLTCYEAVHGTSCPPDHCPHRQLLQDQREHTVEIHEERLGGDYLVTCIPLGDQAGQCIGSVHVARDITASKRTEEVLRLFKEAVDNSSDAVGMSTPEGKHYYQNRVFNEWFGEAGENPPETLYVDHKVGHEVFRTIMAGGQWTGEVQMFARDRSVLTILLRAYASKDETGRITALVGAHTDITERKRAEESQVRLAQEWQTTFDSVSDAIWLLDSDQRILRANRAAEKIFGRPAETMIGKHCWEIVHGTTEPFPECPALRMRRSLRRELLEFQLGEHFFEETVDPILNADGKLTGAVHIVSDITDRKRAEEALRSSQFITENIPVGLYLYHLEDLSDDRTLRMVYANPAVKVLTGLSPEDVIGKTLDENFPGLRAQGIPQGYAEVVRNQTSLSFEDITYGDDRVLLASFGVKAFPLPGNHVGIAFENITEHKRAEEEKKKLQDQLAQAQKMESVGRLAGGVAHDFNNMLGVILGYAELAMKKIGPDEPLHANLVKVRKAAERSADLTQQLLAFARKQTVAPKLLDLNETVEGMLQMLRRLIGEDIDLAWQPGSDLGPVFIDSSQVDQIMANLCVNARDAITGTGKITIETENVSFDEAYCTRHPGFLPGEFVMLAVSDDGCGMDAETRSHLFEPFFTTKEMGKGTGLGLATVYGAVKQNNGFINVYSEPGQGTTFKIYLPQHPARTMPRSAQEQSPPPAAGSETILLVEDEPTILEVTALMLEGMGYAVIAAASPGEALRLAREHQGRIDLLMTDVIMPEMNGRDLAGNLMSTCPDIKRLFMSGYTANFIARHGVLDHGVNFLQKPFSMQELAAKIREALDQE